MPVRRDRFNLPASIAILALLAAGARPVSAQHITLNNTRNLDFGRFVAVGAGTVVLMPGGGRFATGGVILLDSSNAGQAAFNVARNGNGNGGKAISIVAPPDGAIRLGSGANFMAVGGFTTTPATLGAIPAGGTTLAVGATLSVTPNQAPGVYSGTFSLTVD